jgi:hypothetical protein
LADILANKGLDDPAGNLVFYKEKFVPTPGGGLKLAWTCSDEMKKLFEKAPEHEGRIRLIYFPYTRIRIGPRDPAAYVGYTYNPLIDEAVDDGMRAFVVSSEKSSIYQVIAHELGHALELRHPPFPPPHADHSPLDPWHLMMCRAVPEDGSFDPLESKRFFAPDEHDALMGKHPSPYLKP